MCWKGILDNIKFKTRKVLFMCHVPTLGSDAWGFMWRRDLEMASVVCGSFMIMQACSSRRKQ